MGAHAVPSVQYGMVGKLEADWAAIEVVFRVIRKLTAYECTCPACLASTNLSGRIDSPFLLLSEGSLPH
jgi:hypothetical protein